jgi:hypothetical protein
MKIFCWDSQYLKGQFQRPCAGMFSAFRALHLIASHSFRRALKGLVPVQKRAQSRQGQPACKASTAWSDARSSMGSM